MPYAVELYFDPVSTERVRRIWRDLTLNDVPSLYGYGKARPHLTLAAYDNLDVDSFCAQLDEFSETAPALSLDLSFYGSFATEETVIFLGITVTEDLLELHRRFHMTFARFSSTLWGYFAINHWCPHCPLAQQLGPDMSQKALAIVSRARLPIRVHTEEIGLVNFPPPRPVSSWLIRR
jgi:hypothetical protein